MAAMLIAVGDDRLCLVAHFVCCPAKHPGSYIDAGCVDIPQSLRI